MRTRLNLTWLATASIAMLALACSSADAVTVTPPTEIAGSPIDEPVSEISGTSGRIWLTAPTGTFQQGWATLTQEVDGLTVEINVSPSEAVAQPTHIHRGTCEQLGVIEYNLENVIGGHSLTEFPGMTVEDLATGSFAINLHRSSADFATFTACGEIPALP